MRTTSAPTMMATGLFFLMTSATLPAHATNCEVLTSIPHLRCDFKTDAGGGQSLCVDFLPGVNPPEFYMDFPTTGNFLVCKCASSGTFTRPKFNTSKAFLCRDGVTDFQSASGTVSGNKVKKGLFLDRGTMEVFQCAPNPVLCPF